MEALRAAGQAVDSHSQRSALDRLAASLSQHARQRGRTPVPKRPSYVMTGNEGGGEGVSWSLRRRCVL